MSTVPVSLPSLRGSSAVPLPSCSTSRGRQVMNCSLGDRSGELVYVCVHERQLTGKLAHGFRGPVRGNEGKRRKTLCRGVRRDAFQRPSGCCQRLEQPLPVVCRIELDHAEKAVSRQHLQLRPYVRPYLQRNQRRLAPCLECMETFGKKRQRLDGMLGLTERVQRDFLAAQIGHQRLHLRRQVPALAGVISVPRLRGRRDGAGLPALCMGRSCQEDRSACRRRCRRTGQSPASRRVASRFDNVMIVASLRNPFRCAHRSEGGCTSPCAGSCLDRCRPPGSHRRHDGTSSRRAPSLERAPGPSR
ncbi:hypothetical protein TMEC50S_03775 [Thauera mechernichensis]